MHCVFVNKNPCFLSPGPEPATEIVFSNVTESSLTVSWSKPKTTFAGFKVTYINIITGLSKSVYKLHVWSKFLRYLTSGSVDLLRSANCFSVFVMCPSVRGAPLCDRGLSAILCGSVQVVCWILLHYHCNCYTRQSPE